MKNPTFIIKNISLNEIDIKYNFKNSENQSIIKDIDPNLNARTKVIENTKDFQKMSQFSFIDESKKDHVCVITMKDVLNQKTLPNSTNLHCFWCRHSFSYKPIGCPIDYRNSKMYKKYYSEITKTRYVLQESVTQKQLDLGKKLDQNNFELDSLNSNYYLIDGIFCSFNCCYAYILRNKNNPLYKNSVMYLKKIYSDLFNESNCKLVEAPSWRLLKDYGGDLTIEEFRKNFYKIDYTTLSDYVAPFPECKSVGMLFEKKIKL